MVDQGVIAMAELLGLAIVSSGLAVAICGAGSSGQGPLAIAIGLATLGLRGAQLDMLVQYRLTAPVDGQVVLDAFPSTALIAETWLWLALIAVGFVVGRWVESWFGSQPADGPERATHSDRSPNLREGAGTLIVASLVAWTVLSFTLGSDRDAILKGQVYFAVTLSFLLASLVAHWFFKSDSRASPMIVVAVVASAAYIIAAPSQADIDHARQAGLYLNIAPIARPLPLEYAAMGALGALWERDWMRMIRALFSLNTEEHA
jgi:hypothetical protein